MNLSRNQTAILLASLLVLSACAILYELMISTISSHLLGSSVLHFSITIGLFLSFLGLGAWLSKWLDEPLLPKFILIELLLGLVGGASAMVLYFGNAWFPNYYILLFFCVGAVGALAGMEIPLVTRMLERSEQLKTVIARVLAFDYLGALIASLAFPLLMLPLLGTMRAAFLTGLINWGVGVFNLQVFGEQIEHKRKLRGVALFTGLLLAAGFAGSYQLVSFADALLFQDRVVLTRQTPYQRIVVTQWNRDTRLYLNGNLQFCSVDEYRYHEPLVHIPMLSARTKDSVLILGGGDGLALREILKHGSVKGVDMVDLDAEMVKLCRENPVFTALNGGSLDHPKLRVFNEDAFTFVQHCDKRYNVVYVDLPDPSDPALGKLYSVEFYTMLRRIVAADGVVVTQSTSPFLALKPFWCIHATMKSVFPSVVPYQSYVPSFGLWGYNMAFSYAAEPAMLKPVLEREIASLSPLRYLNVENIGAAFIFDADLRIPEQPVNTLEKMELVRLYEESYWDFH